MVAGSVKNKRLSSAMSFRGVSREISGDRNENNRTRTPQIFARGGSPPEVRGGEATKGSEATANPCYIHQEQPGRTRKGSVGYFLIVRAENRCGFLFSGIYRYKKRIYLDNYKTVCSGCGVFVG